MLRDQLHWLPIRQRIDFKIAVFVYNALHGRAWSDIPQPHLQSGPRGRRQSSPAICFSRRPDCASNQDSSLWAQKLPCLGTGRVELIARGHSNSGTVAGTFQIYVENTFISPCICLVAPQTPGKQLLSQPSLKPSDS